MKQEFVPYELAVKLKALGFDEPCFTYFLNGIIQPSLNPKDYTYFSEMSEINKNMLNYENVLAPTFSQAFRWILKNHKLHSFVDIYPTTDEPDRCWFMIRYLERGEDGKEDYMSGWFTNQDNINNSRLNKLLEIIESKSE